MSPDHVPIITEGLPQLYHSTSKRELQFLSVDCRIGMSSDIPLPVGNRGQSLRRLSAMCSACKTATVRTRLLKQIICLVAPLDQHSQNRQCQAQTIKCSCFRLLIFRLHLLRVSGWCKVFAIPYLERPQEVMREVRRLKNRFAQVLVTLTDEQQQPECIGKRSIYFVINNQ